MEHEGKRPSITIHFAQTLDGRIATRTGASQWIGNSESLRLAHQLRAKHDAVLVGVGTVLADDPRLTVRLVEGKNPTRVVVDSTLRLPLQSNVLADGAAPTLVFTTKSATSEAVDRVRKLGVEAIVTPSDDSGRVDLQYLFQKLWERGIGSVLVEGGSAILTALVRAALLDNVVICIAPLILGRGVEAIGDLDVDDLKDAARFENAQFQLLGDNVIFRGQLRSELTSSTTKNVRAGQRIEQPERDRTGRLVQHTRRGTDSR